jgi:hypothetical protein
MIDAPHKIMTQGGSIARGRSAVSPSLLRTLSTSGTPIKSLMISVGIPVKVNVDSGEKANGIPE